MPMQQNHKMLDIIPFLSQIKKVHYRRHHNDQSQDGPGKATDIGIDEVAWLLDGTDALSE